MKLKNFGQVNEAKTSNDDIKILIGKLFQSRDMTHLYHLKSSSYSEHKTLNKYYDDLLDIIDDIIEQYQGYCNCRLDIEIPASKLEGNISKHLEDLLKDVEKGKELFESEGIKATIDEVIMLISKTIYLLSLK